MDNNKENKKEYVEEGRKEKVSNTFKVAMITMISTLLLIAILLILVLLGMKRCAPNNSRGSSSESINTERNNKISDVFMSVVKKQMVTFGFDNDELKEVNLVAYKDNYPTSFDLNITVSSDTKVYYYYVENVTYPSNKDGYDNFVSYLLLDSTSHSLVGSIDLTSLEKSEASFNTSKSSYKAVISKDISDNKYLSGFAYEDNSFFIYQKRLISEGNDPLNGVGDQKISNDSPLFDYYRGLIAA